MSQIRALIIVILLSAIPCFATAQVLWNGATTGMTIEQVQLAFPNAAKPQHPEDLSYGRELLRISSTDYCGRKFQAMFVFKKKQLTGVKLKPLGELNLTESEELYFCIKKDLDRELGTPVEEISRTYAGAEGKATHRLANWKDQKIRIVLFLLTTEDKVMIMHLGRFLGK